MRLFGLLVIIHLLLSSLVLPAQVPESITSLEGAACRRILYNGAVYLTAVEGHGVYYSTDGGNSWISTPISGSPVIALDGPRILAYNGHELSVSLDNCKTWITHIITQVTSLAFIDGIIYRDDSYDGYWKSDDYGSTWKPVDYYFKHLAYKDNVWFRSAWGNNTYQVYKSNDTGNTWTAVPNIYSYGGITLKDQDVWIVGNGVLYHSPDLGVTWTNHLSGGIISHVYLSGDTVYAIQPPYLSRTWDGGQNWETLGPFSKWESRGISDICFANNYYLISTVTGIYRSPDLQNWLPSSKGLNFTKIWSINTYENSIYAITSRGLGYMQANDSKWMYCSTPDSSTDGWKAVAFDNKKMIGLDHTKGVFQSSDTGKTWSCLGLNNGTFFSNAVTYKNNTITVFEPGGYANRYDELSPIWQQIAVCNYTFGGIGYVGGSATQNDSNIVVAGNYLACSKDNGISWTTYGTPGSMTYADTDFSEGYFFVVDGHGNLLRKNIKSNNWQIINQAKSLARVTAFKNTVFTFGKDSLYLSTDTGNTWKSFKSPLSELTDIEFTGSYLYLGTNNNGLWRWKFEDILTVGLHESLPKLNLIIYPNPTSEQIEVAGILPFSTIQILNSCGQVVSEQTVNACHISIDIRTLSAGIYFLNYQSNGKTRAQKFLITR